MKLPYLTLGLCLMMSQSFAAPEVFEIDNNVRPKAKARYLRNAHADISIYANSILEIKNNIVKGMLDTPGRAWSFAGEGEGYILARLDYKGVIVMRIEYNLERVQLKYEDATKEYKCKTLVDGICYKNKNYFYKYAKNLRMSIVKAFM